MASERPVAATVDEPAVQAVEPQLEQPEALQPESETPQSEVTEAKTAKPSNPKNNNPEQQAAPIEKTEEKPIARAPLDVFDPSSEVEDNAANAEVTGTKKAGTSTAPSIVVETVTDKRYNFHYQFKNDKLYLYGTFEKNLYEIMEFFSNNKRTMFLFYKDNYYLLNEENDKVKPLTPISDEALLKKLKDYRKN